MASRNNSAARSEIIEELKQDHKRVRQAFREAEKLDAEEDSEELKAMVKRDIEKSTAQAGSQEAEIEDMRSFIRACSISLKVQNADQAIALLLRRYG